MVILFREGEKHQHFLPVCSAAKRQAVVQLGPATASSMVRGKLPLILGDAGSTASDHAFYYQKKSTSAMLNNGCSH